MARRTSFAVSPVTQIGSLPALTDAFFPAMNPKPQYGLDYAKDYAEVQAIAEGARASYQALASATASKLVERRAALGDLLMAAQALDSFYRYYLERGITRADLLEVALSYAAKYGMEKGRIEG